MNPMEEDNNQEHNNNNKHVCKFCSRSFPCGRSLGGHMRSHVINGSAEIDEKLVATTTMKRSSSLDNHTGTGSEAAGTNSVGYGLRENPKKTWRFTDPSEETMFLDKLCKECGKAFYSWKALFGHMKCHSSEKERVSNNTNNSLDDHDSSWTNSASQKLVLDSQSDNEATAPNRRRRSKRRRTRYMAAAATSSVSEDEQEQEEVAMSLMMLSRDVGPWGGLNSVAESSFNNKKKLDSESTKVTKPRNKEWDFGNLVPSNLNSKGKSSQILATEGANGAKMMNKATVSINGFARIGKDKKPELDSESAFEVNGEGLVLSKSASTNSKYTPIKAKFLDSESKSNSLKNWVNKPSDAEFSKTSQHKRGKFECATCNKIFHSYQALGGHRASHKKIKGCFASRNESTENSIEFEADPFIEPTTESKHMKNSDINEYLAEHEGGTGFDNKAVADTESKKSKGHECPICLKVFQSGQALGGHKRSHLAGGSESSRNCQGQTVVLQKTVPEIRDFLDLNLPASTEEESNSHAEPYGPWWLVGGSNHKQEALVGLMSN